MLVLLASASVVTLIFYCCRLKQSWWLEWGWGGQTAICSPTYLLTYLLTPWCRVLLEKLTGLQLAKKFPAFYGTRRLLANSNRYIAVRNECRRYAVVSCACGLIVITDIYTTGGSKREQHKQQISYERIYRPTFI